MPQVRTRPSSDDAHEVALFRRHRDGEVITGVVKAVGPVAGLTRLATARLEDMSQFIARRTCRGKDKPQHRRPPQSARGAPSRVASRLSSLLGFPMQPPSPQLRASRLTARLTRPEVWF